MAWWDEEFDLGDFDLGGVGYDTGAFDIPSFDLSNIDLGGAGYDIGAFDLSGLDLGSLDLGNLENFGFDLGNLDLGNIDLGQTDLGDLGSFGADVGLDTYDLGGAGYDTGAFDVGGVDLGSLSPDIKGDISTILTNDVVDASTLPSMGIDIGDSGPSKFDLGGEGYDTGAFGPYVEGTEGFADAADVVGGAAQQDTSESQFSTSRKNADGTITQTFDDGSTITVAKDPQTGQETVVDYTTATDVPPPGGEIVPSGTGRGTGTGTVPGTTKPTDIKKEDIKTTDGKKTTDDKKSWLDQLTGSKDNTALLMALIGGLMGLMGRKSAPRGPVGYQGGIPKYTATRVPGHGVQYTRAANGGLMSLAEGGRTPRYLRGGTDGMADKIQTSIDGKQPARLSHGEFVIPADVVSHLGNGNSDAGADVLYDMMAKVRKARTGTPKQGKQINPRQYTPA